MRALQIIELAGPDHVRLVDVAEPDATHPLAPDGAVVIDVKAASVSFPDVLQTRGRYQTRFELPLVPGGEVAGVVRSAPPGSQVVPGQRVVAFTVTGGMAERATAPPFCVFGLPSELDFAEGAALMINYHTAYFALAVRGRLAAGERVLVHGAAGGVGTASLQVAKALGASTIAIVSSDEKEAIASRAGAGHVLRSDGPWRDEARDIGGGGVDIVLDPVGGDRAIDSLRVLREEGRLLVVGFAEGSIPSVKLNRLLLNNVELVGVIYGPFALARPQLMRQIGDALDTMVRHGAVRPIVGTRLPLERGAEAMRLLEQRRATGKVVLDVAD